MLLYDLIPYAAARLPCTRTPAVDTPIARFVAQRRSTPCLSHRQERTYVSPPPSVGADVAASAPQSARSRLSGPGYCAGRHQVL